LNIWLLLVAVVVHGGAQTVDQAEAVEVLVVY
jgi:hypothetical protein